MTGKSRKKRDMNQQVYKHTAEKLLPTRSAGQIYKVLYCIYIIYALWLLFIPCQCCEKNK